MHISRSPFKPLAWLMTALLSVVLAGCGGDGDGGGSDASAGSPITPSSSSSSAASSPSSSSSSSVSGTATAPGAGTGVGGLGQGPAPVDLATAGNFVVLAQSAITNVPSSAITGNVGLSPASGAFIGLSCVEVTGVIYTVNAAGPAPCYVMDPTRLTTAIGDKGIAYTNAAGRAPDYNELGAGNIGGLTLGPATYRWTTPVLIPASVTLSGGPNDVWIFQLAQGLTVSSGVKIILAGGARAQNVFWQTFAAADFGTTVEFKGVVLSQTSIVMKTGATIDGRLLAGTAVTLDQNRVTQP